MLDLVEGFAFALARFIDAYSAPLILALVLIALFSFKKRALFIAALILALLLTPAVKDWYQADRPCVSIDSVAACPLTFGFPSSHAAVVGVFAIASLATWSSFFFVPVSLFVMWSRVALGVHSVHQVVAGFAFGLAIYVIAYVFSKKIQED